MAKVRVAASIAKLDGSFSEVAAFSDKAGGFAGSVLRESESVSCGRRVQGEGETYGELRISSQSHGDPREDGRLSRSIHTDEEVNLRSEVDSGELVGLCRQDALALLPLARLPALSSLGSVDQTRHEILEMNLLDDTSLSDLL